MIKIDDDDARNQLDLYQHVCDNLSYNPSSNALNSIFVSEIRDMLDDSDDECEDEEVIIEKSKPETCCPPTPRPAGEGRVVTLGQECGCHAAWPVTGKERVPGNH